MELVGGEGLAAGGGGGDGDDHDGSGGEEVAEVDEGEVLWMYVCVCGWV